MVVEKLFEFFLIKILQYCWKQNRLLGLLPASEKRAGCWMAETWLSQVGLGSSSINCAISHLELRHMITKEALMKNEERYLHSFTSSTLINLPLRCLLWQLLSHVFHRLCCPCLRFHTQSLSFFSAVIREWSNKRFEEEKYKPGKKISSIEEGMPYCLSCVVFLFNEIISTVHN